jgi:hypothetical protein
MGRPLCSIPFCGGQLGQPDRIAGGEVDDELAAYTFEAAQHGLGCKPNGLAADADRRGAIMASAALRPA